MSDFFCEVLLPVVTVVVGALLAIGLCIFSVNLVHGYFFERSACSDYGVLSKQKTYWAFATSCLVETSDGWVSFDVATKKKQEITIKQR